MKIDKKLLKNLSDYLDEFNLNRIRVYKKIQKLKFQKIMFLSVISACTSKNKYSK